MQRWSRLSVRQVELLGRIADGDDLSATEGIPHRTSARALQSRRLVNITRADGMWRATITEAGRFYLQHGFHPDDPARLVGQADTRSNTEAGGSSATRAAVGGSGTATATLAQRLVNQLTQGDGVVRIEEPDEQTRAHYRRAIHAAKQHNLVPDGYELRHTGRNSGDIVVVLYDKANGANKGWDALRVATRHQLTVDDEMAAALRKNPSSLAVSAELLPRALEFVHLLAGAARARGHRLVLNTKGTRPTLSLRLEKSQRAVKISEEREQVPHVHTEDERRRKKRQPWIPLPEFDFVPSGRLVIEVNRTGYGKSDTWKDDKRSTLESRAQKIIKAVEDAYLADQRQQQEWERIRREEVERWEQQKAEERAQWEQAKAAAAVQAKDKLRADQFRAAFDNWVAAGAIRSFCTALEGSASANPGPNIERWVAWARSKADQLDPTTNPSILEQVDFDIEPGPPDLEPFMGEWSATSPQKAYRSEATRTQYAEVLAYETTWHHGMRGNPQAWRYRR